MNVSTAFRIVACRSLFNDGARAMGLDCGLCLDLIINYRRDIFSDTNIKSNFLCCIGYGDSTKIFQRLPRLNFDEVCKII